MCSGRKCSLKIQMDETDNGNMCSGVEIDFSVLGTSHLAL